MKQRGMVTPQKVGAPSDVILGPGEAPPGGALRQRRGRPGGWIGRQDLASPRPLGEVEVATEIAQQRVVLPDIRTRVRPPVGGRVEPLAGQEVVFDELVVVVVAENLMVDVA